MTPVCRFGTSLASDLLTSLSMKALRTNIDVIIIVTETAAQVEFCRDSERGRERHGKQRGQ